MTESKGTCQVSVIIPAYNAEALITKSLESALQHQSVDMEIIVCDDRSTDNTLQVLKRFAAKAPRLTVLANPTNMGCSASRNRCLEQVRGDWVAVLDADDGFEPDRLRTLLTWAEKLDADLVADNIILDNGGPDLFLAWDRSPKAPPRRIDMSAFLKSSMPLGNSLSYGYLQPLIRKRFLDEHALAYNEQLRMSGDFEFLFRCLEAGGRFFFIPTPLYRYRMTSDSITRSPGQSNLERLQNINQTLLDRTEQRGDKKTASLLIRRGRQFQRLKQYRKLGMALGSKRWLEAVGILLAAPMLLLTTPLIYKRTRAQSIRRALDAKSKAKATTQNK